MGRRRFAIRRPMMIEQSSRREVQDKYTDHRENIMRRIFRIWRMSRNDLRILWGMLRHPNRPIWLLPATLALAFFALEPLNFAIPILGVIDDLVLLPLLLHGLAKLAYYMTMLPQTSPPRDDRVVSVQ
jgi:uncharacterized membrane protein YkvA (DUF1232 family)